MALTINFHSTKYQNNLSYNFSAILFLIISFYRQLVQGFDAMTPHSVCSDIERPAYRVHKFPPNESSRARVWNGMKGGVNNGKVMRGEGVRNSKKEDAFDFYSKQAAIRPVKKFFSNEKDIKLNNIRKRKRKRNIYILREREEGGGFFQRYYKFSECSCCIYIGTT